jgi:hypothetical protein
MAKQTKRAHRNRRSKHSKRSKRSRGGMAPVSHNDMGWSSKMSMGQGGDYLKYHVGQHGGAELRGADVSVIGNDSLPSGMIASAHLSGLEKAFGAIRGLSDQAGGRRRSKRSKRSKKSKRSKRSRRTRRRGGAMGYAPFPSGGMLLSAADQAKAGLNPHWRGVETDAAAARASL